MERVNVVTCGPAVNESERKAIEQLKTRLISAQPDGEWLLLTNLPFSATHRRQSDEIDILAIGPPGVRVVEVKHWGAAWAKRNAELVEQEADLVTLKARKVGTTLRRRYPEIGRVDGAFLLTESAAKVKGLDQPVRGVPFHTFKTWREALNYDAPSVLDAHRVRTLGATLTPKSRVATDGRLKRLAGYANLQLQTPPEERFHRVFTATHSSRRDQVILHLYDCSVGDDANTEHKARREFDALHRLQRYSWAPRIVDSFQPAPGYHGEAHFFTVVDPAAPTIQERAGDGSWDLDARRGFARSAIRALHELHRAGTEDQPLLHRNLTPETLLVKHDNSPVITGLHQARIPSEATVGTTPLMDSSPTTAPEVRTQGRTAADRRSDVYSMCASLMVLFEQTDHEVAEILAQGMADQPKARSDLATLNSKLARLLGEKLPASPPPPVRFWTEEQRVQFRDYEYRIVSRLGSGGIGTTFKVVEIDPKTGEDRGAYVAKAIHGREDAERVMDAYRLARPHLRHPALSAIYEFAREWQDNGLSALMTWVEGEPLDEYAGLMPILAEDHQEATDEALAIRWLKTAASALDVLHRSGLVHGDVSPRNMIVNGSALVLTDYDCVTKVGERYAGPGTVMYCSPSFADGVDAAPSDDIFALAASFFHVLFERQPFLYGGDQAKDRGLNWAGIDRDAYALLAPFFDRATAPQRENRYATVEEALTDLAGQVPGEAKQPDHDSATDESVDAPAPPIQAVADGETHAMAGQMQDAARTPNEVPWLKSLLQSYPGSPWGNSETRGLDSDFADKTYVETKLEQALYQDVMEQRISLVVLCGNAGDGKTALLQHLAKRFGLGSHTSKKRILEGRVAGGLKVQMNLDGSASWQGESATELLDRCFGPFHDGPPRSSALFLAINDGRLLEWIEETEERIGETRLTKALLAQLEGDTATQEQHIRFVNLNERSLVGSVAQNGKGFDTGFLEDLVDKLYGGDQAQETWAPCLSCAAQDICEVYRATRLFGPVSILGEEQKNIRIRARGRLFEALQAVHLRGETHITMRELRAALVYILFGTQYCDDYHEGHQAPSYADRAFSPQSRFRQGEVLADLVRYDPGIETHPKVDRYLSQTLADDDGGILCYPDLPVDSARRRAYFEWTEQHLERVANDGQALGLAQGRHLRLFRDLGTDRDASHRAEVARSLCAGISRLESLPPQALDRQHVVPLRITPRTPTETAFWVEKPLASFRLEVDESAPDGFDWLHREAFLVYRYEDGRDEKLRLGADLFHLLLDLGEGLQLGDVSTDDTFAQLSIFVQRLVREDHRRATAWNPMQEDAIFEIAAVTAERSNTQEIAIHTRRENCRHG